MRKAISKEIFDEIVGRAACGRPAVAYRAGGKASSREFPSAREAFAFVHNTLEIAGHAAFRCEYRHLDNAGAERRKEIEIEFDRAEGCCAHSADGFADELVYRLFLALAGEIHAGGE